MKKNQTGGLPELSDRETYTVKQAGDWLVELLPMVFNWRVCLTPIDCPTTYSAAWCYFGTGQQTLLRAYAAAQVFDPLTEMEPAGFDKALQSPRSWA